MIKNGAYHVSLSGDGKLYLSKDKPHITLQKYSDGTIRNEEGNKCLMTVDIHIILFGKHSILQSK